MASGARKTKYGIEYVAQVLESRALTPSCHHIRVERHPDFAFDPVQYTFLSLRTAADDSWDDYRPMSLASSPTRPHLEYGVRLSESPWKRAFKALKKGDEVMVEGAVGHFILDAARPAVLLAGGIGITPLKGMAEYAADKGLDIPVRLLYTNRTIDEIAYAKELDALAKADPNFEIVHTITRGAKDDGWKGRRGRIDRDLLEETSKGLDDPAYYVCGTPEMVETLCETLTKMGVADERILYEEFWGY